MNPAWIIVAEDNGPDVYLIREALNREGLSYRLEVIDDGGEMLNLIERLEEDARGPCPDLLVLDLNLPKHSGGEILTRLRAASRCADIPVMVMSSSNSPRDLELAGALGAGHYFRKPSDLGEFLKIGPYIRTLLEEDNSKPRA